MCMNKEKRNKKRILSLLLVLTTVLASIAINGAVNAYAADYSYNESKNYNEYSDNGLTVRFTLTNNSGLNMHYWTIFLFNPNRFNNVTYNQSTHKLTNSGNMNLSSCDYAFKTDNTAAILGDSVATAAPNEMDLKGSGKSLSQVWSDGTDWVVVLGPCHDWYENGNKEYNCDYYVGDRNEIP